MRAWGLGGLVGVGFGLAGKRRNGVTILKAYRLVESASGLLLQWKPPYSNCQVQ